MDAIELLKKDHEKVARLFDRYRGGGGITGLVRRVTGNVSTRERRSALERICRELTAHADAEEAVFYPAVRRTGDAELSRQVDESLHEHQRMKDEIKALRGRSPEEAETQTHVDALEQCVQHHVREEENEMFPRVEQVLDARQRGELGKRVQARKRTTAARKPTSAAGARRARATTARAARGRGRTRRTAAAKTRKKRPA